SLGNAIDPLDMIKKYGADATRLSLVIGTTPGNDMNLSEDKIAGFRNFANKLWNISRYVMQNAKCKNQNDNEKLKINYKNLTESDRWILNNFNIIREAVSLKIDNYEFSAAGEVLRSFTWNDFADWYLEVSKFEKNKEKNNILIYVLENLLKLWHPFMPFVTEKIWQEMGNKDLLIIQPWPERNNYFDIKKSVEFEKVIEVIKVIRNARAENKVEPKKKVKVVVYAGKYKELIESQAYLIKGLRTGVEDLEIMDKGPKIKNEIYISKVDGIDIYLIGVIDKKKEKERIEKEIGNLNKLIKAGKAKLNNKEFIKKAPAKIVKQERKKLKNYQEEINKLNIQFNNLC
ncbi:MAG: class I tRNA ligase family protein, partial [Patescibacteria group bacterium]